MTIFTIVSVWRWTAWLIPGDESCWRLQSVHSSVHTKQIASCPFSILSTGQGVPVYVCSQTGDAPDRTRRSHHAVRCPAQQVWSSKGSTSHASDWRNNCRDLKGENILQSATGNWVLCDFGSAQTIDMVPQPHEFAALENLVYRTTTAAYRAPEVCLQSAT